MTSREVGRITITVELEEDGTLSTSVVEDDEPMPLVQALGVLRLAEDTIIRDRMGETPP